MLDIVQVLRSHISTLESQLADLERKKESLQAAISILDTGETQVRGTRRPLASQKPMRGRRRGARRKRGANQQAVLSQLGSRPVRLKEIAASAGLNLSSAAGVLRAVIRQGKAKKGVTRGTYLAK